MRNVVTQPRVLAKIPSHSNPTKMYEIRLGGDGVVYCTCRAWITNKFCKHLEQYHSNNANGIKTVQLPSGQHINMPPQAPPNPNAVLKFFESQAVQQKELHEELDKELENYKIFNIVKFGIIQARWDLLTTTREKKGGF